MEHGPNGIDKINGGPVAANESIFLQEGEDFPLVEKEPTTKERLFSVLRDISSNMENPHHYPALVDVVKTIENKEKTLEGVIVKSEQEKEKLASLVETDNLTGLANRKKLLERLDSVIALNKRKELPNVFSVVYFDLDGFKAVNDTFGHPAGDLCLKLVAEEVKKILRGTDLFARLGGDEFVILLEDANADIAKNIAEKVLQSIKENVTNRLKIEEGGKYKETKGVSASLGVVSSRGEKTSSELVEKADSAMYASKSAGKGVITVA